MCIFRTLQFFIFGVMLSFFSSFTLSAVEKSEENLFEDLFCKGVQADLREPSYSDGVLTTTQGGVITGPNMRIQARNITYTRKLIEQKPYFVIEAEGDLMLEFNGYIFVGESLEYDFQEKVGIITQGRSVVEPWYFGGEKIRLLPDSSYIIENGFVTTSEGKNVDWKISSAEARLYPNKDFSAKKVKFKFFDTPFFWLPSLSVNLDYIFDTPIRYSARWGGKQGPRAELIYEIFSWNRLKTFLRLDYRLTRGPGIGFETYYRSPDHRHNFEAINYIARDSSIENPSEKYRFRFQGSYNYLLMNDKMSVNLVYDKLSDKEMATDYSDSGLDLEYTGMTRLRVRRQEQDWISNFVTTVRLNSFQTVKEELPAYRLSYRPYEIGNLGVIVDTQSEISYLDYKYAKNLTDAHDYHSGRLGCFQRAYRPIKVQSANVIPEIGGVAIYYTKVRKENQRLLLLGTCGVEANLPFSKLYGSSYKHVVTPYLRYQYFTYPTIAPDSHYIFDIDDGWYRVNHLTLGVSQSFYTKHSSGYVERPIHLDLYADAFFDTKTLSQTIQKINGFLVYNSTPWLRHSLDTAWDVAHQQLGRFNLRTEWTYNENFAIAAEFRYRDAYDWRKADHTNFVLESYRSTRELLDSSLSDRRDTLLLHFFYRFNPNWGLQFQSRHGWNRRSEPPYNEIDIDLIGTMQTAWQVKLSYQHRENDHHRFSIGFNVGLARPDRSKCVKAPLLNF